MIFRKHEFGYFREKLLKRVGGLARTPAEVCMRTTGVTTMVVPDGECLTGVSPGTPCGCKCLCAREGSPGTTKTYTCMRTLIFTKTLR